MILSFTLTLFNDATKLLESEKNSVSKSEPTPTPTSDLELLLKTMKERVSTYHRKLEDAKLELQAAKLETRNAMKALSQEVGEGVPLSKVCRFL